MQKLTSTFEQCDGADLDNKKCTDLDFGGGTLKCFAEGASNGCKFDYSLCTKCAPGETESCQMDPDIGRIICDCIGQPTPPLTITHSPSGTGRPTTNDDVIIRAQAQSSDSLSIYVDDIFIKTCNGVTCSIDSKKYSLGNHPYRVQSTKFGAVTGSFTVVGPGTSTGLTATPNSVNIAVGATYSPITITGGSSYKIKSNSDSAKATTNPAVGQTFTSTFTITGVAPGSTNVVVEDVADNTKTVTVQINVGTQGGLGSSQNPVYLKVGQDNRQNYVKISGGAKPYTKDNSGCFVNDAVAYCDLVGEFNDLVYIEGRALGTASAKVKDSAGASIDVIVNVVTCDPATRPTTQCTQSGQTYQCVNNQWQCGTSGSQPLCPYPGPYNPGFDIGFPTDNPTTLKGKVGRAMMCKSPDDESMDYVVEQANILGANIKRHCCKPSGGFRDDTIDLPDGTVIDLIYCVNPGPDDGCLAAWQWIEPGGSNCGNGNIDEGEDCEPGPPMKFKTGVTDCKTVPGNAFTGGNLECHSSGDDACTYDTSGCTGGTVQPPTTNCNDPSGTRPAITFVSPAIAKVGDTLSITGSDLTRTVQFYPAAGAVSTYTGTVSADCGRTTIQIPASLSIGKYSVKVYKAKDKISGGFEVTINGNVPKCSPDGGACGYCSDNTQCLVNPLSTTSPCINSGEYSGDNYCENGEWSSRTKLLALKLLNMKSGNYVLFCDDRENSLNNLQYMTESNEVVANVLTNLKTNNFCVLKTGNSIIAATSTDKKYEEVPGGLNIFGVTSCSAATDSGQYVPCSPSNKVWYNKKLKSYIYSTSPITVPANEVSFADFIKNPISAVIEAIKRLIIPSDQASLKEIKKFDRLYMAQYSTQQGAKAVIGSIDGKNPSSAVIEYSGYSDDICKFVEDFGKTKAPDLSKISCKKENNKYYVFVQGSEFTNINPEPIWPDLTSKLRLK